METISKRMKRLRQARGLSVKEAASAAEVPLSTYREWEAGRQIKGEPYEKIARALQVSLHELITGKTTKLQDLRSSLYEIIQLCHAIESNLESLEKN
jgi:transcriptional regulator with XRE-family HTH domain